MTTLAGALLGGSLYATSGYMRGPTSVSNARFSTFQGVISDGAGGALCAGQQVTIEQPCLQHPLSWGGGALCAGLEQHCLRHPQYPPYRAIFPSADSGNGAIRRVTSDGLFYNWTDDVGAAASFAYGK